MDRFQRSPKKANTVTDDWKIGENSTHLKRSFISIVDVNEILNKSSATDECEPKVKIQKKTETVTIVDINEILQGANKIITQPQSNGHTQILQEANTQPHSTGHTQILPGANKITMQPHSNVYTETLPTLVPPLNSKINNKNKLKAPPWFSTQLVRNKDKQLKKIVKLPSSTPSQILLVNKNNDGIKQLKQLVVLPSLVIQQADSIIHQRTNDPNQTLATRLSEFNNNNKQLKLFVRPTNTNSPHSSTLPKMADGRKQPLLVTQPHSSDRAKSDVGEQLKQLVMLTKPHSSAPPQILNGCKQSKRPLLPSPTSASASSNGSKSPKVYTIVKGPICRESKLQAPLESLSSDPTQAQVPNIYNENEKFMQLSAYESRILNQLVNANECKQPFLIPISAISNASGHVKMLATDQHRSNSPTEILSSHIENKCDIIPPTLQIIDINSILNQKSDFIINNKPAPVENDDDVVYNDTTDANNSDDNTSQSLCITSKPCNFITKTEYEEATATTRGTRFEDSLESSTSMYQQLQMSRPTSYQCLNFKKRNKIDLEGLTYFDRKGFFKAEYSRAKRCDTILKMLVKVKERVVETLIRKFQRFESFYPEIPTIKQNQSPIKGSPQKPTSCMSQRKIMRKPKIILPFDNSPLNILKTKRTSLMSTFIHEDNLTLISQISKRDWFKRKTVYFVNSNNVQTCLYLDAFPLLREAVNLGIITIISEETFKKYNEEELLVPQSRTTSKISDANGSRRLLAQYVSNFHAMLENNAKGGIQAEHNYSYYM